MRLTRARYLPQRPTQKNSPAMNRDAIHRHMKNHVPEDLRAEYLVAVIGALRAMDAPVDELADSARPPDGSQKLLERQVAHAGFKTTSGQRR